MAGSGGGGRAGGTCPTHQGTLELRGGWGEGEREERETHDRRGKANKMQLTVLAVGERDPLGRYGPVRSGIIIKGYPGYGGPLNNPPSCLFAANMAGQRGARTK